MVLGLIDANEPDDEPVKEEPNPEAKAMKTTQSAKLGCRRRSEVVADPAYS